MKIPRKLKKEIKSRIKNETSITQEIFNNESFFLHVYKPHLNSVINSLIFLNYPSREELVAWWEEHYPKSEQLKLAKEADLLKDLGTIEKNIRLGYLKQKKLGKLLTIY